MNKTRPSLALGTIGLLVVLGLMAGCYRPAAPDVTPTPAGGVQGTLSQEDMQATAAANATLAAQAAEATSPVETPTVPPATATPLPTAAFTPVPTTPAPTTLAPTSAPAPAGQVTHVVQRGENLFRIALRYGTTVQAIASANGITNPSLIYAGQKLVIPTSGTQPSPPATGTTYVVQPGDNLFRIALRYNMSYLYLAQYNGIANPSRIYVGQVLRIPPR